MTRIEMSKRSDKQRSGCPISRALDIFGDKWTLLIIRDLVFSDKHRYKDFLGSDEKIATNVLASRLVKLEENGLVVKRTDPDNMKSSLYELTPKGIGLVPTILELGTWSAEFEENLNKGKEDVAGMRASREANIEYLQTKLMDRYNGIVIKEAD
jgi:DNA-binding HxlR family transcriptional regulator